jgi:hypothetical protein
MQTHGYIKGVLLIKSNAAEANYIKCALAILTIISRMHTHKDEAATLWRCKKVFYDKIDGTLTFTQV